MMQKLCGLELLVTCYNNLIFVFPEVDKKWYSCSDQSETTDQRQQGQEQRQNLGRSVKEELPLQNKAE